MVLMHIAAVTDTKTQVSDCRLETRSSSNESLPVAHILKTPKLLLPVTQKATRYILTRRNGTKQNVQKQCMTATQHGVMIMYYEISTLCQEKHFPLMLKFTSLQRKYFQQLNKPIPSLYVSNVESLHWNQIYQNDVMELIQEVYLLFAPLDGK